MRHLITWLQLGMAGFWVIGSMPNAAQAAASEAQIVGHTVRNFANAAIQQGVAVGVAVAVVDQIAGFSQTYVFGKADLVNNIPFARNSIFEIASNTKTFTTNLLGQAVFEGTLGLNDRLSFFRAEIGQFVTPLTGTATLKNIADFTGGFPDYAPLCSVQIVAGCLPAPRPTIQQYSARNFTAFFRSTLPANYNESPPPLVTKLPAPYLYSDFSIGMLGLLLGTPAGTPIADSSVYDWFQEVETRILRPLQMTSTYLDVPASRAQRIAQGYSRALASAQVTAGQITTITVLDGGVSYSSAPAVTIAGGGGSGAAAVATIKDGQVDKIQVRAQGTGYIAPTTVVFNGGGSTTIARAMPIVSGGKVVAVEVRSGGAGYRKVPAVKISGGGGTNAAATAHIANGRVIAVSVTNGGAGYVTPLTVTVAPGEPQPNAIPVWAPAGALQSTIDDMAKFATAVLGSTLGVPVPVSLTEGFRIAERAYACSGADPEIETCPPGTNLSGLAWDIIPAGTTDNVPEVVTKNGGLPGFSSQIFLLPTRRLAVVVLINCESHAVEPQTLGKIYPLAGAPAQVLAFNIGYDLLFSLP